MIMWVGKQTAFFVNGGNLVYTSTRVSCSVLLAVGAFSGTTPATHGGGGGGARRAFIDCLHRLSHRNCPQNAMPLSASRSQMHENKYLHLPVVDNESGTVVGVVNVMEIVQATAGAKGSSRCVPCATNGRSACVGKGFGMSR